MLTKESESCPNWMKKRIALRRLNVMVKRLSRQERIGKRLGLRWNDLCQFSKTCCSCPLSSKEYGCILKNHLVYFMAEDAYDPGGRNNPLITEWHINRCAEQLDRLQRFILQVIKVVEQIDDVGDLKEMRLAYWVIDEAAHGVMCEGQKEE